MPQHPDKSRAIAKIVEVYGVGSHEAALDEALGRSWHAYHVYQLNYGRRKAGLGRKDKIDSFKRALSRTLHLARDPQVRNRLDRAAELAQALQTEPEDMEGDPYSVGRDLCVMRFLLEVAERASLLEGRTGDRIRRDDLRAAAEPLYVFWTKVLKRPGSLWYRDDYSEPVKFIVDCLRLIDASADHRLIVDLDLS